MAARVRRTPDEARRLIMEAAERRLTAAGPDAVTVQGIAADIGVTDAAVYHHYGSRDALMESLARFGARRLKESVERILAEQTADLDLARVLESILDTFETRGYGRLVLWLGMNDVPLDRESGMFDSLAAAIGRSNGKDKRGDAREIAALLVLVAAAEPFLGTISRRSVGLGAGRPTTRRFRAWFADRLSEIAAV